MQIVDEMVKRRAELDPSMLLPLASGHESYSETKNFNATFRHRTVREVSAARIGQCVEVQFLTPEALTYFWPRVLQAMFKRPNSRFSRNVIDFVLLRSVREGETSVFKELSREDVDGTKEVLSRMLPHIEDLARRERVEEVKGWLDGRSGAP